MIYPSLNKILLFVAVCVNTKRQFVMSSLLSCIVFPWSESSYCDPTNNLDWCCRQNNKLKNVFKFFFFVRVDLFPFQSIINNFRSMWSFGHQLPSMFSKNFLEQHSIIWASKNVHQKGGVDSRTRFMLQGPHDGSKNTWGLLPLWTVHI